MRQPVMNLRGALEELHRKAGQALVLGSRLLTMMIALGAFFCLMFLGGLAMMRHPEQVFQLQSFQLNYIELKHPDLSLQDPSWDGALAGFGLGAQVGQVIPVFGCVAGPVFGAVLGYQLDERI